MQQKIFEHFHICIYSDAITLRKTDVFGMALLYANQSYVVVSEFFKNVLLDFCLLRSKLIFRYLRFGALLVFSIKRITLTYDTKKTSRIPSFLGAILERRRLEKKISATKEEVVCHLLLYRKEGDLLGDVVLFSKRKLASQDLKIAPKLIFL